MVLKEGGLSPDERSDLAYELWTFRSAFDRRRLDAGDPGWGRDGIMYLSHIYGLQHFLEQIGGLSSKTWLDVGAGNGKGAAELSHSPWVVDNGISVETTTLSYHHSMEENIEQGIKTHVTSAEMLSRIPDESIGGITALFSAAYSSRLDLVAKSFFRVLVDGGLIKMSLFSSTNLDQTVHALQAVGFEVAIYDRKAYFPNEKTAKNVILARKPGGENALDLQSLLLADATTFEEQIHTLASEDV